MSSNIAVSISAEVSGLTAGLAQAKASLLDTNKALRDGARSMNEAGSTASTELRTQVAQAGEATAEAQAKVTRLSTAVRSARGPMDELSHASEHQAGIVREKLVLAHETLMGNYKGAMPLAASSSLKRPSRSGGGNFCQSSFTSGRPRLEMSGTPTRSHSSGVRTSTSTAAGSLASFCHAC